MQYEYISTNETFLEEKQLKLQEDIVYIERIKMWLLLSMIPIFTLIIYYGSNYGSSRHRMGTTISDIIIVLIFVFFSLFSKIFKKIKSKKIINDLMEYERQNLKGTEIIIYLYDNRIRLLKLGIAAEYAFSDVSKVVFGHKQVLFILKDKSYFSIFTKDTVPIYDIIKNKIKYRIFEPLA